MSTFCNTCKSLLQIILELYLFIVIDNIFSIEQQHAHMIKELFIGDD